MAPGAPALDNTNFPVREVYSQTRKYAAALADKLYQAEVRSSLDFSASSSRIFILAVSDDAIQEIAQEMILPANAILVHTSGSQPLSILGYAGTPNIGVLYPLQTFTKGQKVDFKEIPFFIESESEETEKVLMAMAKAISKKVRKDFFARSQSVTCSSCVCIQFHQPHVNYCRRNSG
jgi:predicted short-subunit dehydrogenase-like oxidoreductase (DUF2520 family)